MDLEPRIVELLNKRGIESEEDIAEFVSDKPQRSYDPFLLLNMEEGVDLILSAIDQGKKICVYGDYDADGITSTVILTDVLSELTKGVTAYIPSRFDEGYGLNRHAIDEIAKHGVGMIVTVDCGSVSVEEVAYAKELGLDILVTDHHVITDRKADCLIINPAQPECTYPCKFLAGCGVAFKLAQALVNTVGLPKRVLTRNLDMVGIGTIGDIVPLKDENRTFAKYGLRAINTGSRMSLSVLLDKVGLKKGHVTSENVSYIIVPHINAAGRMAHAKIALKLFKSRDREKAEAFAEEMVRLNMERKRLQNEIYTLAAAQVEEKYKKDAFLFIELPRANEGVTGIAAGKLKETYSRPSVIVTDTEGGILKGTGRSMPGINLYDMLKREEDQFLTFGGHAAACGFTMRKEHVAALRENLVAEANAMRKADPSLFVNNRTADLELSGREVTFSMVKALRVMEPCGCANEQPLIGITGRADAISRMGAEGKFLRFTILTEDGASISCVAFQHADEMEKEMRKACISGEDVRVLGALDISRHHEREYLQLRALQVEPI